jgi:hypothetical protein
LASALVLASASGGRLVKKQFRWTCCSEMSNKMYQ